MKVPCYGCPDRNPGCHGRCEKYQEYDAFRQGKRKAHMAELEADDEVINRSLKVRRAMRNESRVHRLTRKKAAGV